MADVNIKFSNGINSFLSGYSKNKSDVLTSMGLVGVSNIKAESPVLSGKLQSKNDYETKVDSVLFYNSADYAKHVANGTFKQSANPFMKRGVTKSLQSFKSIILNGLSASSKNYNVNTNS